VVPDVAPHLRPYPAIRYPPSAFSPHVRHYPPSPIPYPSPGSPAARTSSTFRRLQARLRGLVGKAIDDYAMIAEGDRVMVCLSGGKDSYTLLDCCCPCSAARRCEVRAGRRDLDQKQPGFPAQVLPEYLGALGVPYEILEQDTYSVVKRVVPEGRTHVRPVLAAAARNGCIGTPAENGITKIALGHHRGRHRRDAVPQPVFRRPG